MAVSHLIQQVRSDCAGHGYGRKKWWADRLGIPPLTLSHWFAGRQKPGGEHALSIRETLDFLSRNEMADRWKDYLSDAYYSGRPLPKHFLPDIVSTVLSKEFVDSRTLALLSLIVERSNLDFQPVASASRQNRLGWLLEISGKRASFKPDRVVPVQTLLESASKSAGLERYLKRFQTKSGKKWRIYDCPLEQIKESLPWPQKWNELSVC